MGLVTIRSRLVSEIEATRKESQSFQVFEIQKESKYFLKRMKNRGKIDFFHIPWESLSVPIFLHLLH